MMSYSSRSGKKLRFLSSLSPFLIALFLLPFNAFSSSLFPTLFFFSCWIMIIQLLHIEQQQKVISGSVYLEKKVINDKTITIELESVS